MRGFNYSESNASAAQKFVTGYNYLLDKDNNTGKNNLAGSTEAVFILTPKRGCGKIDE